MRKKLFIISMIVALQLQYASPAIVSAQSPASAAATPIPIISQIPVVSTVINAIASLFKKPEVPETPVKFRALRDKDFRADEDVTLVVENAENKSELTTTVLDPKGKPAAIPVEVTQSGSTVTLTIEPPQDLVPGVYEVTVKEAGGATVARQEFAWGVLAVNTNKSIYLPNETAHIAFGVLDENGAMVCDAKVTLDIITPATNSAQLSTEDGTIIINQEECQTKAVTQKPDYEASYTVGGPGTYQMTVTAKTANGVHSITDAFQVQESVPFDVERITATRIYPPETYPVTMKITVNQDFEGTIAETVPHSFTILPAKNATSYDLAKSASESAAASPKEVLGTSDGILGLPFNGSFPLTQGFGVLVTDALLLGKYIKYGLAGHDGLDYALPTGTPVLAADSGQVVLVDEKGDYGMTIVIQHPWGKTYYGHLSKFETEIGKQVAKGEQIARSGNTGESTGPHLHFGIKPNTHDFGNGYYGKIDPLPFMSALNQTQEQTQSVLSISDQTGLPLNAAPEPVSDLPAEPGTKQLTWDVTLKKGETITIGYSYKAPLVSPYLYTLGPLRFFDTTDKQIFTEQREWQIAADAVTIDSTAMATVQKHNGAASKTVFISDQVGYAFYVDSTSSDCVYSKTTDAGANWGARVTLADGSCDHIAVWYDRWTPTDNTGNYIYIITTDGSLEDLIYNRLDTAAGADTVESGASGVNITDTPGPAKTNILSGTSSFPSIGKATDGTLFVGVHDGGDVGDESYILKCSTSCSSAANWSDTSAVLAVDEDDSLIFMPLADGDMMAIVHESSPQDFKYMIYDSGLSTWGGFTTIDAAAQLNGTYDAAWGAVQDVNNYTIYLVYAAAIATIGTDDDIRTAVYNGSSWTIKTDVVTNSGTASAPCAGSTSGGCGVTGAKVAYDEDSGTIYAIYTARTTGATATTTNVYYKTSIDGMNTWSAEQGPLNDSAADFFGVNANLLSKDRIYATWVDGVAGVSAALYGATVSDLAPKASLMKHGKHFNGSGVIQPYTF